MLVNKMLPYGNISQILTKSEEKVKVITINRQSVNSINFYKVSNNFSTGIKRITHSVQDLFNPKVKHIYNRSGVLSGIKELEFKDKDGVTYLAMSYCKQGKIITRTLYDINTREIAKKYTYSPIKKNLVMEEEIFEKGKLSHTLSHEYDNARAIHKIIQKDAQNNVESTKIYNLYFPNHLMKVIKP